MSYLNKVKTIRSHSSFHLSHQVKARMMPDDAARHSIMRVMADWNERAAMMTCCDLTPEQAELAAWHDLKLDVVFFGSTKYH